MKIHHSTTFQTEPCVAATPACCSSSHRLEPRDFGRLASYRIWVVTKRFDIVAPVTGLPMLTYCCCMNDNSLQASNSKADISRVDAFTNASMGDTFCPNAFSPGSYECWGCQTELHNVYLHCVDCQALEYDYNVCSKCFIARRHRQNDKHHKKNHKFQMRYADLTDGCNSCHREVDVP